MKESVTKQTHGRGVQVPAVSPNTRSSLCVSYTSAGAPQLRLSVPPLPCARRSLRRFWELSNFQPQKWVTERNFSVMLPLQSDTSLSLSCLAISEDVVLAWVVSATKNRQRRYRVRLCDKCLVEISAFIEDPSIRGHHRISPKSKYCSGDVNTWPNFVQTP